MEAKNAIAKKAKANDANKHWYKDNNFVLFII
jgi:hypothetical protein